MSSGAKSRMGFSFLIVNLKPETLMVFRSRSRAFNASGFFRKINHPPLSISRNVVFNRGPDVARGGRGRISAYDHVIGDLRLENLIRTPDLRIASDVVDLRQTERHLVVVLGIDHSTLHEQLSRSLGGLDEAVISRGRVPSVRHLELDLAPGGGENV